MDDLVRCSWPGLSRGPHQVLYQNYHDNEWGRQVSDPIDLFERMTLEGFQSGLSWITILQKRNNFRRAFNNFDIATVASYTLDDVERLISDATIVRNRAKILATISNARVIESFGMREFAELLWSFAPDYHHQPSSCADIPASTHESHAMAQYLKKIGIQYCGPISAYSLMQATGMVNDHLQQCWVKIPASKICGDIEIDQNSRKGA